MSPLLERTARSEVERRIQMIAAELDTALAVAAQRAHQCGASDYADALKSERARLLAAATQAAAERR